MEKILFESKSNGVPLDVIPTTLKGRKEYAISSPKSRDHERALPDKGKFM
jgi:hypothetical protein